MRKRLLAICLIAAAAYAGIAVAGVDDPTTTPKAQEHDFGTKVLVVGTRPRPGEEGGSTHVLEKARVRKLGDRYFIVGQWLDFDEVTAYAGTTMWTPVGEIDHIMEFDNLKALKKAYADRQKEKRER